MSSLFSVKDVKEAYRKLKHYIYYDTTNVVMRKQIAEYEYNADGNLTEKFLELASHLNEYSTSSDLTDYFDQLLDEIGYWTFPKSFISNEEGEAQGLITNKRFEEKIQIEKPLFFIKAPIELHLVSVLWIIKIGYKLESDLEKAPYGNKLNLNERTGEVIKGLKLFKPYFREYQRWRDQAIKTARNLVTNESADVALVSLDIKDYFNSVKLNFKDLKDRLFHPDIGDALTNLLESIHLKYNKVKSPRANNQQVGLPIGLLSSFVLANWYLRDFDTSVLEETNPIYYGRYVDDIIIVLGNPKVNHSSNGKLFKENFFNHYFVKKGILSEQKTQKKEIYYRYDKLGLEVQPDKVSLLYFSKSEPITLIDNFQHEIQKNSSEFRFLPEDVGFANSFQQEAHSVVYDGSKFKLRSVKNLTPNKFGASKFLAKKIFSSLQSDKLKDLETVDQLIKFFKGERVIEYYQLWEKLVTYFLISKQLRGLKRLLKNIEKSFEEIEYKNKGERKIAIDSNSIKSSLREHLRSSFAMAFALAPKLLDKTLENLITRITEGSGEELRSEISYFRKSNLVRHNYVFFSLLNYTKSATEHEVSLIDKNYIEKFNPDNSRFPFGIDEGQFEFSPRFVHFHEVVLFVLRNQLGDDTKNEEIVQKEKQKSDVGVDNLYELLDDAFDVFYCLNYTRSIEPISRQNEEFKRIQKEYFHLDFIDHPTSSNTMGVKIRTASYKQKDNIKVALGNISLQPYNMQQSYFKKPIISGKRRDEINSLLNQVHSESKNGKVDLFVLPEVSIPHKWIKWLGEHCRKHQTMMIFGIEHWPINNIAYNLIVTFVPTKVNTYGGDETVEKNFNALIPIFRIKNHYSPGEIKELKGYRYNIPIPVENRYDVIDWQGLHFAVFNCFEIADIGHRALLKSRVDFIVASEYNKDVNYFSNIVESVTRDVHCYFIQSNNSAFGDNRITRPSSTVSKDLIKLKGGKNTTILVDTIDIAALRRFQLKDHNLQLDDDNFKPTPPGFDVKEVEKRMGLDLNS